MIDGSTLSNLESGHNAMNSINIATASPAGIINKYEGWIQSSGNTVVT
jgi:hypothetical protein